VENYSKEIAAVENVNDKFEYPQRIVNVYYDVDVVIVVYLIVG
jgi:hypothetical protein